MTLGSNEEKKCLACDTPFTDKNIWGYCNTCWNDSKIMKAVSWEKYCDDKDQKKPLVDQFNIHKFYKPNKEYTNRWVWRKLPARLFKKPERKEDDKKT